MFILEISTWLHAIVLLWLNFNCSSLLFYIYLELVNCLYNCTYDSVHLNYYKQYYDTFNLSHFRCFFSVSYNFLEISNHISIWRFYYFVHLAKHFTYFVVLMYHLVCENICSLQMKPVQTANKIHSIISIDRILWFCWC